MSVPPRARSRRARTFVALTAAFVGIPAFVAVAHAATGGHAGATLTPAQAATSASAHEHSGTSVSDSATISATDPATPETPAITPSPTEMTTPEPTEPTEPPENEPTEPVGSEPGDDHGADGVPSSTPAPPVTQVFASAGGSIQVTLADGALTLDSTTPAAGFTAETHDAEANRVEVRFSSGDVRWQIRVEVENGAMVSEVSVDG